mmetsp:Transcript_6505/g.23876  ORF Transcript_6505/g.23876 Transcript_6505/m.23876 type:complete len:96 (+) Transcript_6505:658-945(+)
MFNWPIRKSKRTNLEVTIKKTIKSKKLEYVRGKSANRAFFYSDHSRVILRKLPNERSIKWFAKSGISHCHTYIKLFEHLCCLKTSIRACSISKQT